MKPRPPNPEAGITLVEILIAGAFIALAACGMAALLAGSLSMNAVNKETAQARTAARRMLEELQNVPASDVFATFNTVTEDDPLGQATAPGSIFSIQMKPAAIQVSDMTGTVVFPEYVGQLREDLKDENLGMPRDLNGDGVIDSENHAKDYLVLPVRILVEWRGMTGERTYELHTVLLNK
jgi:hypothetical protein